jgi:hypothetical protein
MPNLLVWNPEVIFMLRISFRGIGFRLELGEFLFAFALPSPSTWQMYLLPLYSKQNCGLMYSSSFCLLPYPENG